MKRLRSTVLAALALLFAAGAAARALPASPPQDAAALLRQADALFDEGSFARALALYEQAAQATLEPAQARWVRLRAPDARWRSAAASPGADTSELDRAERELRALVDEAQRAEQRDRVWAEAAESLGDFYWRDERRDFGSAWGFYSQALAFWARSSELDLARGHYLRIVEHASRPSWYDARWGHGAYGNALPRDVLANVLAIAPDDGWRAWAHYALGTSYANDGAPQHAARALSELEQVIALGKASEWYDDALFQSAVFLETRGRVEWNEQGSQVWVPDYAAAATFYRRLLDELRAGETRYRREATERLRGITAASLSVSVERFFLPGSEVPYALAWRNVASVELSLVPFDLTRDVPHDGEDRGDWLARVPLAGREAVARWTHDTQDTGEHRPGTAQLYLEPKPAPGAYVLVARAGGEESRALVLVSDLALTVKATGRRLLAWATDLQGGAPRAGARLHLWQRFHDGRDWRWRALDATSGEDGTWLFELQSEASNVQYFLAARAGDAQAFVQGGAWSQGSGAEGWRTYVTTDRPAYRPGDLVQWKVVAREQAVAGYRTPVGETLAWELLDPQGASVAKGEGALSAFGTLWGSLQTRADMALGEYQVRFERVRQGGRDWIGQASVFRLEEYKLPEFEVAVSTPEREEGGPRVYVLGDEVTLDVTGSYYFGGPVAGAEVEVFVYQRPFYRYVPLRRDYPWLYEEERGRAWWGGPGQQVLHQTLRTDADGRAQVRFETPVQNGQDLEYTVEARMTDASRREVVGQKSVRVTRTEHAVQLTSEHQVHRPGSPVTIDVRAADANDRGVVAEGTLRAQRQRWVEVWTDPSGRRVLGDELERLRREDRLPPPGTGGWQRVFAGYESESVAETTLTTNAAGEARWTFTPPRAGHYRVRWSGRDGRGTPIEAETRVLVADEASTDLGYRAGGIEIVVDKDTFVEGDEAAFVLLADQSGRWVLVTVEAGELLRHEVVRMEGSAKLMRLPIDASHVPNFWLTATSVSGGQAHRAQEQVVVPPTKRFLDVEARFAQEAFEPGAEGELRVLVRDHQGRPVRAELSLAVYDAAVEAIGADLAGDPRRFFYGDRRGLSVSTQTSLDGGRFVKLERKDGPDERGEYRGPGDSAPGKDGWFLGQGNRDEMSALGYAASDAAAAPMAKSAMREGDARQRAAPSAVAEAAGPAGGGAAEPTVRVRSDFRDTALWLPDVVTDEDGSATVRVPFPDATSRWQARVRGCDAGASVGQGEASARTRLPLIARLQAPRFFRVGDECLVSANLNNNTDAPLSARVTLAAEGLELLGRLSGGALADAAAPFAIEVPAGGVARVDWRVRAREHGTARLELSALAGELGDAVRRELSVLPHGIEALVARAGKLPAEADGLGLDLALPPWSPGSLVFDVQLTPSLAVTMLDALPYLVDYPYGCTEQTLSRFLPSAIVAATLRERGLSAADAMERVFGGIEREFADKTHPPGKQPLERLGEMTAQGLERLYDFQHSDGGWGWWKDGESDSYMTAYVVWGLALGRDAGLDVRAGALENGARWLALHLVELEQAPDLAAWSLHALAAYGRPIPEQGAQAFVDKAFERLWSQRERLNACSTALFTLAAAGLERTDQAQVLARNLANGVRLDRTPDTSIVQRGAGASQPYVLATAHWGEERSWWRWSDGAVESTAFALRALLAVDPQSDLVVPAMNWLVKNRRGAQWSNTRDTAISVLALDEYLSKSGELDAEGAYELLVNGERAGSVSVSRGDLLRAPSVVRVPEERLREGANRVELRRVGGAGALYFAVQARLFSLEEPIAARGNEIFVRRQYYKLVGRPTLLAGTVFDRVPLADGDTVASGERVEVVLTVEAKNDLEYILFEDHKPAGLEAVGLQSGAPAFARELRADEARARFAEAGSQDAERRRAGAPREGLTPETGGPEGGLTGRSRWIHQELRDTRVVSFLDRLPQGFWELRYDLRAEVPGRFHGLPLEAHAMYVPEIRANGSETRLEVLDRGE